MTGEAGPAFVDTNVLVYAFERGDSARKEIAQELLKALIAEGQLRTSTQVLQELFVTLTRKARQPSTVEGAVDVLDQLSAWPVVLTDYPSIREAAGLSAEARLSFWDALVVVAAARCGAGVLYSEDMNAGQEILGVRIVNPFRSPV